MQILGGIALIIVGVLVVIFHDKIRRNQDKWNSMPFLIGLGDSWTGKYTRGGLLFVRGVIVLSGVFAIYLGIRIILQ